jgi:hypothetical protein
MVIHLVACWFFIYSFMELAYLHDHKFIMALLNQPKSWINNPKGWHIDVAELTIDIWWISLSQLIGVLTGFILSLAMSIRKHWYWLNSLIVFFVAFSLQRFNLFGWHYVNGIFLAPGRLFKEYSIGYFLVNGLIMLAPGLLLLFLGASVKFIEGKPPGVSIPESC